MAKKTTGRSKTEPIPETAPAAAAPVKPRARAKTSRQDDDAIVASHDTARASDTAKTSVSMGSEPSDDDIRLRAYHRYLERGGGHGMHFEDWLEAKRDLLKRK